MTPRRLLLPAVVSLAVAGAGLAACATPAAGTNKSAPRALETASERGRQIAVRDCAGCHAIDTGSDSERLVAPPFREIRTRYSYISLSREFIAIGQFGHHQMPPTQISRSDSSDLIAFIKSLGP
jgi:mono/diheme cytochrome c family protein